MIEILFNFHKFCVVRKFIINAIVLKQEFELEDGEKSYTECPSTLN